MNRFGAHDAAAAAALLLIVLPTAQPERLLRASPLGGAFGGSIGYLAVGRSSTVGLFSDGVGWRLTNNGLPESFIRPAGYPPESNAAQWLSILPVLLRPDTARMVIIGLGAGITVSAVPSSVASIDVIELEPEVVAANRTVPQRADGDPLADPRVSIRYGDARGALILADRRYDAIVSQPSHPWTAGASHLYTREFFALVRSRLEPRGVFVQWIGSAFVDPERLRALLAAQTEVFAHVQVYRPDRGAIVMVASDEPFDVAATAAQAIAGAPRDYAVAGIHRIEDVIAALSLDDDGTRAFTEHARANSDDRNLLATSDSPSQAVRNRWVDTAFAPHDPLPAYADAVDLAKLVRAVQGSGRGERIEKLAARLDPPRSELALGWIALGAQHRRQAGRHFTAALESVPKPESAAIGLALSDPKADTAQLSDRARAVVLGQRSPDLEFARGHDEQLAQWQPGELLYPEAAELRARWRLELGEQSDLAPALGIIDTRLEHGSLPRLLLFRAELAARDGKTDLAWLSLDALGETGMHSAPGVAQRGLALARKLGAPPSVEIVTKLDRIASRRAAGPTARRAN